MTTRQDLEQALQHPNVKAFLRVIREGETNQTDNAYAMLFGGGYFTSFNDHPRKSVSAAGFTSTAAGAYQILAKTWDGLVAKYGFENFGPLNQDLGAVGLVAGRKALDALMRGDLADVLDKCSWEWASLPPSRYNQHVMDGAKVYKTYEQWGGNLTGEITAAPPPAEPREEGIMAIPGIVWAAASELLPFIADLFRGHGSQTATRNADIIEKVGQPLVDIAKTVTGISTVAEAVEAVKADPAKQQEFRKAVEYDLDKLIGMIERITKMEDESRDKAATRAKTDTIDILKPLLDKGFQALAAAFIAEVAILIIGMIMKVDNNILMIVITLFVATCTKLVDRWGQLYDYRVGSSAGSHMKDEVIAANRK